MAANPPVACRTPGCYQIAVERGFCPKCLEANPKKPDDNARHKLLRYKPYVKGERTEHDKLMAKSQWINRTSPTLKACNPICQLIVGGVQCTRPAVEVHHIDPDLKRFFDPSNLVGLCRPHNHKGVGDDPANPREYAPTKWILGAIFEHPKPPKLTQGQVVITAQGTAIIG
jgi:hypothetical protein